MTDMNEKQEKASKACKNNKTMKNEKNVKNVKSKKNKEAKPANTVKAAKSEKIVKTPEKKAKTSRSDVRQALLMAKTLAEAERVERDAYELFNRLYSVDSKELTPIDRHLMQLQLHAMESYASTLRTVYAFESVRTRRRGGEFLNRSKEDLLKFIYGVYASYESGCQCGKDCKKACKKAEKAKESRPEKIASAVVVPLNVKVSTKPEDKKTAK